MKKHIFLVDDNPHTLMCYQDAIEGWGYDVSVYPDAASALSSIGLGNRCDLLITDYRMPGMNGLELIEQLGREGRNMAVLLWSVHVGADLYSQAKALGAECMEKTGDLATLKCVLDRVGSGAPREQSPSYAAAWSELR